MSKKRLLVVDTSVARAAGKTKHPVSSACRECLLAIRRICHRVAVTPAIRDEWKRHRSRFTGMWMRSMAARQKPLKSVPPADVAVDTAGLSQQDQKVIQKDLCLLEAALSSDRVILSLDESFRKALSKAPDGAKLMKRITWINPVTDGVAALENL